MKRAYVAFATVTLALGAVVGCKGKGNTGGAGGTGGTTGTSPTTSSTGTGSTTGSMTTATTGSMTTATTGTTTGTMSSTSSGPIMCTGMASNIPKGTCDLLNQDCTGNGTCAPFMAAMGGSTTDCTPSSGLKPAGAACTTEADCQKGLLCIGNICSAVCCPDTTGPGANKPCGSGSCNTKVTLTGTTDFLYVCSYAPACTPFASNACMQGLNCIFDSPGLMTCNSPSPNPVGEGQPCMAINDCGNMEGCFAPQGSMAFVCRYLCDTSKPAGTAAGKGGCPTGQTCTADSALNLGATIGICGPAAGG